MPSRISLLSSTPWLQVISLLALLGLASLVPCQAETPSAELLRYDTRASMDPDTGKIEVSTRLSLEHRHGQSTTVGLLLNNGLEVDSVAGPGVLAYRVRSSDFAPIWNLLEVDVDSPVDGGTITFDLAYRLSTESR